MENNYYKEIKDLLISNEVYKKVKDYSKNKSDLNTYYNVGKILVDAGKQYGEGIIKKYSVKLTIELGKGYSKRNLWLMLKFFELKEKMQTLSAQLTWSHYVELLSINDIEKVKYYIKLVENSNLSVRELRSRIKNKEYKRLPKETKEKLINKEKLKNDNISGEGNAIDTHYMVGKKVRETIKELGGTMPEELPTPERSIKEIEKSNLKKIEKN